MSKMNINEILNVMDDMLEKAWSLPLTGGKCVVDVEHMSELINDIRLNMPQEVKQAKLIVADRVQIINDAKREAEDIVKVATERAKRLVAEEDIVQQATQQAKDMIAQAQQQARDLKKATSTFADELLAQTEEMLLKNISEVKETRSALRKGRPSQG